MMQSHGIASALSNPFTASLHPLEHKSKSVCSIRHAMDELCSVESKLQSSFDQSNSTLVFLNYHTNRFISIALMKRSLPSDGSVLEWHCDFVCIDLDTTIVYYKCSKFYYHNNDCYIFKCLPLSSDGIIPSTAVCVCSNPVDSYVSPSGSVDKKIIIPQSQTLMIDKPALSNPKCKQPMCLFLHLRYNKRRRLTIRRRRQRVKRKSSASVKIPINQSMISADDQMQKSLMTNLNQDSNKALASNPLPDSDSSQPLMCHQRTNSAKRKFRHPHKSKGRRRNQSSNFALFRGENQLPSRASSSKSSDSSSSDNDSDSDSEEVKGKPPTDDAPPYTPYQPAYETDDLSSYGAHDDKTSGTCAPLQSDNPTPGSLNNTKLQPSSGTMNVRDVQPTTTPISLPSGEGYGTLSEDKYQHIDRLNAATHDPALAEETTLPPVGATITHSHCLSWQQSSESLTNDNYLNTFNGLSEYCDVNSIPRLDCAEDYLSKVVVRIDKLWKVKYSVIYFYRMMMNWKSTLHLKTRMKRYNNYI